MTIPWKVGETYQDKSKISYKLIMIIDDPDYTGRPLLFASDKGEDGKYRSCTGRTIEGCMYLTGASSCYDIIPPEPEVVVSDEVWKAYFKAAFSSLKNSAARGEFPSTERGIKAALAQYKKELEGK